jgi:hypothetical protein
MFKRQTCENERRKLEVEASFPQVHFALFRISRESDFHSIRSYIRIRNLPLTAVDGLLVSQHRW